jgi:hypothetical protein
MMSPETAGLAGGAVVIKHKLPLHIVLDFMSDKYVWHDISPPLF